MKLMRRIVLILLLLAVVAAVVATRWYTVHSREHTGELLLYGNVDLRQVDLAFNNNERIASVLVEEGHHVKKGQVLARLDTSRLEPRAAQADAEVAAQREVVARLKNGSRPEEISQAQANVASAQADVVNAQRHYDRYEALSSGGAVAKQERDDAKAALDVALAKLLVNQKSLELAVIGPRAEDVAQGEAQLKADEAQAALLHNQLADAQLLAPVDAVVRTRIMEPGEMASPQTAVFSLAVVDPKWVRAYVSEPDLGKIRPGMAATVTVDSFPGRHFDGWVGFISPVAEFTPKTVETTELRTSLVYEVRVFVTDPGDELRLGMPATVHLPLDSVRATPDSPAESDDGPDAKPSAREASP